MSWPPPTTRRYSCPDCWDGRFSHATRKAVMPRRWQPSLPQYTIRYVSCPNRHQTDHTVAKVL